MGQALPARPRQQARGAPHHRRDRLRRLRGQRVRAEGEGVAARARNRVSARTVMDTRRTVEAVWRIEGVRIVASVAKMTGDLGLAEDVAQEAVLEALSAWPRDGVPRNP